MVEITGNQEYCIDRGRDCPVKRHALYKKLERCGIYRRFRDCTFENIEKAGVPESIREQYGQVKEYAAKLKENIAEGQGLLLKGSVGTMKTTLAVAVLRRSTSPGAGAGVSSPCPACWTTFSHWKARNPEGVGELRAGVRETPLLVLDDLGAEYTEGWVLTMVDAVVAEAVQPLPLSDCYDQPSPPSSCAESSAQSKVIGRLRSTPEQDQLPVAELAATGVGLEVDLWWSSLKVDIATGPVGAG
ncbi:MAG: hypothetical protein RJR37_14210 [Peptococcaceae bacterium MAG4]|nr:hypothetical protein [Peptococcaceae bacterium MAG4]